MIVHCTFKSTLIAQINASVKNSSRGNRRLLRGLVYGQIEEECWEEIDGLQKMVHKRQVVFFHDEIDSDLDDIQLEEDESHQAGRNEDSYLGTLGKLPLIVMACRIIVLIEVDGPFKSENIKPEY